MSGYFRGSANKILDKNEKQKREGRKKKGKERRKELSQIKCFSRSSSFAKILLGD